MARRLNGGRITTMFPLAIPLVSNRHPRHRLLVMGM